MDFNSLRGNISFNRDGLDNFNKFMGNLKECSLCEEDYYGSNVIKFYLLRSEDEPNELFDNREFAEHFLDACSVKDNYVRCDKCNHWELVNQETYDNFQNNDTHFYCIECKFQPTISPTNLTSKKKAKSKGGLKKKVVLLK